MSLEEVDDLLSFDFLKRNGFGLPSEVISRREDQPVPVRGRQLNWSDYVSALGGE